MIRIRNNIFKKKKKSPHNENIKKLYNTFRNRINRDLKKSKVEYYSNYFEKMAIMQKKLGKESNPLLISKIPIVKMSTNLIQIMVPSLMSLSLLPKL